MKNFHVNFSDEEINFLETLEIEAGESIMGAQPTCVNTAIGCAVGGDQSSCTNNVPNCNCTVQPGLQVLCNSTQTSTCNPFINVTQGCGN